MDDAKSDMSNSIRRVVLSNQLNSLEIAYLEKLRQKFNIKSGDGFPEEIAELDKKFYAYGYNSIMGLEFMSWFDSEKEFELAFSAPPGSILYSRLAIIWLYDPNRKHWIVAQ